MSLSKRAKAAGIDPGRFRAFMERAFPVVGPASGEPRAPREPLPVPERLRARAGDLPGQLALFDLGGEPARQGTMFGEGEAR